jgi:hypothetical protein
MRNEISKVRVARLSGETEGPGLVAAKGDFVIGQWYDEEWIVGVGRSAANDRDPNRGRLLRKGTHARMGIRRMLRAAARARLQA